MPSGNSSPAKIGPCNTRKLPYIADTSAIRFGGFVYGAFGSFVEETGGKTERFFNEWAADIVRAAHHAREQRA